MKINFCVYVSSHNILVFKYLNVYTKYCVLLSVVMFRIKEKPNPLSETFILVVLRLVWHLPIVHFGCPFDLFSKIMVVILLSLFTVPFEQISGHCAGTREISVMT